MRRGSFFVGLAGLFLAGVSRSETPEPDFFAPPSVAQPRLSPDGAKIAFLFPHEGRMILGLFDRKTGEARSVVHGKEESLLAHFWKGNDRLVFAADYQGNESFFVGATDLAGRKVLRLVETQPSNLLLGSAGGIVDALRFDPDRIAMVGYLRPPPDRLGATELPQSIDFTAARVNVRNRGISPLYTFRDSDRTRTVHFDNAGVLRLRSREVFDKATGHGLVWELRDGADSPWREIARHPRHGYAETWEPDVFSADNTKFYLLSREEHDRGALYAYDAVARSRGEALFVPPEGEIVDVVLSYDRTRLLGVACEAAKRRYHWFDADRKQLQAALEAKFAGQDVRITSTSADERVALLWVSSDREPAVYFVLDRDAKSIVEFKRTRPWDPRRLRPMEPVVITARDGVELHGYLTRPAGAENRPGALIVHPHGGPFGVRDSWGFDPEVQFLASLGYAVLQVNFRGSGGYGRRFLDLGRRQWGRAMQDDLTDAVRWAVAQGIADPQRVGIYGASYGGYATLAGLALTPDLYRCGVNYVGATDLEITFMDRGQVQGADEFDYRREWVGATREYREETSPLNFVDRIRVPSLHVYGANDRRVVIDHWWRLEAKLKQAGAPYESLVERRQGHGFRDERADADFHRRLREFLARHLPPG